MKQNNTDRMIDASQRFLSIATAVLTLAAATGIARAQVPLAPPIELGVLAVISDGKQDALTYSSGNLAPPERPDRLTLWTAPFDPARGPAGGIDAPNSNFSPSGVAVISRDGRRAYVVETMMRPPGETRLRGLVPANRLRAFDITDPANPRALAEVTVGRQPRSLALSGDGRTVVTLSGDADQPLGFAAVTSEGLAAPVFFGVPGVRPGFTDFSFIQWSPTTDAIAVNLASESRVLFFSVDRDAAGLVTGVRPWGNPVSTNKYPLVGRFTPDGRHYLTSDVNWGSDVPGFSGVRRGFLSMIRVADSTAEPARHFLVDADVAGLSAESFTVSPDGQWVVASNIETTGHPVGAPRYNGLALLTLHRLDGERSQLARVGETRYPGLLPQGIVFDAASRYVLVGTNELMENRSEGGVLVFRLERTPEPRLVDTGVRLRVPPGVHSIAATGPQGGSW